MSIEKIIYYCIIGIEFIGTIIGILYGIINSIKTKNSSKIISLWNNLKNKIIDIENAFIKYPKTGDVKKGIAEDYAKSVIAVNNIKNVNEKEIDDFIEDTVKIMNTKRNK